MQAHDVIPDELEGDIEFEGHAVQGAEPTTLLYVPAVHAEQELPACPVNPTSHMHEASDVLPAGEVLPDGQLEHAQFDKNWPAPQIGQTGGGGGDAATTVYVQSSEQ